MWNYGSAIEGKLKVVPILQNRSLLKKNPVYKELLPPGIEYKSLLVRCGFFDLKHSVLSQQGVSPLKPLLSIDILSIGTIWTSLLLADCLVDLLTCRSFALADGGGLRFWRPHLLSRRSSSLALLVGLYCCLSWFLVWLYLLHSWLSVLSPCWWLYSLPSRLVICLLISLLDTLGGAVDV
jgi:hypothetical protein